VLQSDPLHPAVRWAGKKSGQFPASFTLTESSAIPFVFVQLKKLSNGSQLISTAIVLIGESSEVLENQTG